MEEVTQSDRQGRLRGNRAVASSAQDLPPYRDAMPTENAIPSTRTSALSKRGDAGALGKRTSRERLGEPFGSARASRARSARTRAYAIDCLAVAITRLGEQPAPSLNAAAEHRRVRPGPREEEVVPMSPFRRTIAERLVRSKNTAALLTTFNEVDLSVVQELRSRYQEVFQKRYGVKLGFMSFFVKAVVEALKQIPVLNAELRETDIVYKNYFDIGIAVGGGRGLVVPVIRNAEHLGLADIERTIADFGKRAKENKLELEELTGGTFTITNGGVYGSMLSTPIINPPQSGILGLHAIQDRPVARDGQVVIRPMMYVALTYDHRIVDGREAVTFLRLSRNSSSSPHVSCSRFEPKTP